MKCKNPNCNNKLGHGSKTREGFTGLCQHCWGRSSHNKSRQGQKGRPKDSEELRTLKTLATQNQQEQNNEIRSNIQN